MMARDPTISVIEQSKPSWCLFLLAAEEASSDKRRLCNLRRNTERLVWECGHSGVVRRMRSLRERKRCAPVHASGTFRGYVFP